MLRGQDSRATVCQLYVEGLGVRRLVAHLGCAQQGIPAEDLCLQVGPHLVAVRQPARSEGRPVCAVRIRRGLGQREVGADAFVHDVYDQAADARAGSADDVAGYGELWLALTLAPADSQVDELERLCVRQQPRVGHDLVLQVGHDAQLDNGETGRHGVRDRIAPIRIGGVGAEAQRAPVAHVERAHAHIGDWLAAVAGDQPGYRALRL